MAKEVRNATGEGHSASPARPYTPSNTGSERSPFSNRVWSRTRAGSESAREPVFAAASAIVAQALASSAATAPLASTAKREVQDRKERFAALNAYIIARSGFMVSVPGDPDMRFEALPARRCRSCCAPPGTRSPRPAPRRGSSRTRSSRSWWLAPAATWSWRRPGQPGRSRMSRPTRAP